VVPIPDIPILTRSQVRAWLARKKEIAAEKRALDNEDAILNRKLEAVMVLNDDQPLDNLVDGEVVREPLPADDFSKESFPEAVIDAVKALGGTPRPGEIRAWLCENGATIAIRDQAAKPYFYAVLMRHAAKNRLVKVGDGYGLPAPVRRRRQEFPTDSSEDPISKIDLDGGLFE
jgi:hypothetical protein